MNSDKFDRWQEEVKTVKIDGLDEMIRRKIIKQKKVFQVKILKTAFASVLTLFITFALLVNMSPEFYTFAYNNKILGPIAEILKYAGRNDTKSAFDMNYAQAVNIKLASGYFELDIDYIISDTFSVSLFGRLYYKGRPYKWKIFEKNPQIELFDDTGKLLGGGGRMEASEDFLWIEMLFIEPNAFKPITIRFNPYASDDRNPVSAIIENKPETSVKLIKQNIGKTFVNGNQKLWINSIEVGAFQSRLNLQFEFENMYRLNNIQLKYSYLNKTKEDAGSIDSSGLNYNIAVGQLMKPGPVLIELLSASYVDKSISTANVDMNTFDMTNLPSHLTIKEIRKTNNRVDFKLVNEHGNSLDVQTSEFWGTYGISYDPEIPGVTNFFIECDNHYNANIEIQFRDVITVPFYDAKFEIDW